MNVRSITLFAPLTGRPTQAALAPLGLLGSAARTALEAAGFTVQTTRLALPSWPTGLADPSETEAVAFAQEVAGLAAGIGTDYVALGPVRTGGAASLAPLFAIPAMLAA